MTDKDSKNISQKQNLTDALKSWMMVVLTLIFVVLYAAALSGWLKPLSDVTMITRLEPIIFVIIGYYFGRLPAQQNEKTLKDEINRQTQKADAAQHIKETAQQEREALEERLKNAKTALGIGSYNISSDMTLKNGANADMKIRNETIQHSVETAILILNS